MKKNKNKKSPDPIEMTPEQVEALDQRIHNNNLTKSDLELLSQLLSFSLWLQQQLANAKFTIKKLKRLFGFKTEKKKDKVDTEEGNPPGTGADAPENNTVNSLASEAANDDVSASTTESKDSEKKPPKKPVWSAAANHGRYGFDDYPGCKTVVIPHPTLKVGDLCPNCRDSNPPGKLYRFDPGSFIRLVGGPLITGTRYEIEVLRCHLCSACYSAEAPPEIKEQPRYGSSAKASIAVGHYVYGLPFKRIEAWQANYQIPVPDATQYDKMVELEKMIAPVYSALEYAGAQGDLLTYDDTSQRILECIITEKKDRKGVYSTAVVCKCGPRIIYLFYTNQQCAGREVDELLKKRESEKPLLTMRDASSQNNLKDLDESLLIKLIIAFCLVHGRRKFYELLDDFPVKCQFVIDCIACVYRHEAFCKNNNLSADERLLYHQTHSKPIMDALWIWLNNLWLYHGVEPNSGLGQAVSYMLRHWSALTQFLRVPGISLDSSIAERAIKVVIRYRKNSLFYKTLKGARVGDKIMSLIHTAIRNDVNAFEYLIALQDNHEAVAKAPESWLPWNYQRTLAEPLTQAA